MWGKLRQLPRSLIFLYVGTIVTRMGAFVFPYLTIYLTEHREFGFDHVGLILSVGSVGLLLGNIGGGWLTDHWSRHRTLLLALVVNAIGFAGLAFPYQAGWPYAVFLAVGYFGSGMYNPAANTLIADLTEDHTRSFAYTVNYVCVNLGMALGPLIGGFLANVAYSWIFVGDVATTLTCAGLIAVGVKSAAPPAPLDHATHNVPSREGAGSATLVWLRHPLVLAFCLAYFFLICPLMGLEYAVPLLVKNAFAGSLAFVGIVYTINAICILSFSFLVERFIRPLRDTHAMIAAGLFWSAGLAILFFGYSIPSLMICTAVWTIGEIIASITVPTFIAARVDASVKGRFLALNDVVRSAAGILCPICLGLIWTHQGPQMVLAVLLSLPFVAIVAYLAILVHERKCSLPLTAQHAAEAP